MYRFLLPLCLLFAGIQFAVAQIHKPYPASVYPDRLVLGWQGDPATSQSVNWRTDSSVTQAVGVIAEADASPDFGVKAPLVMGTSEPIVLEGRQVIYHSVHFQNLKPATQYAYRVGDGEHWSEWFHFRTAQASPAPFSFLYFGDAQNDIRSLWSRAIRGAYSTTPKAQFMIHAGDLVTTSNADWQWGEWFEAGGWLNGMVPVLATPGNHEYFKDGDGSRRVSMHWRPQFVLPENGPDGMKETAYFIDYQGVRFVFLDSQGALLDSTAMQKQATWLTNILTSNPNRWTILTHHHPIYSTASGRDNKEWRQFMEPIYRKYKVDLVLQGHDHTYGRGLNMPLGKSRNYPDGPIYVVSVSGPKMYDIGLQDWMDRAASNTQLYQSVSIDGNKLSYQSFLVTGELYDAFDLTKDAKGRNLLTDRAPAKMPERLELPADDRRKYKPEQLEEYNRRFREYKTRKEAAKKG